MKTITIVAVLLILLVSVGCDKKEEVNPFDKNLKIKNIKVPGAFQHNGNSIQGHFVTHIKYNGDKIEYITNRSQYAGNSVLNDSTRFFYTGDKLEYATRVKISQFFHSTDTFVQQHKYEFSRDQRGEIIQTTIKALGATSDFISRYSYQDGRLIAVKRGSVTDSITYNAAGKIETVKTFPPVYFSNNKPSRAVKINSFISSASPYYIINKRLGFPFMASREVNIGPPLHEEIAQHCVKSIHVTKFNYELTLNGPVPNEEYTVEYMYVTDKKGRVTSQYTAGYKNLETIFEYY